MFCPSCTCCPLHGTQGHLEVFRQSVVIRQWPRLTIWEGWVWPSLAAQRPQGWHVLRKAQNVAHFSQLRPTHFPFLSRPSPPIPPTWRDQHACTSFQLPGTPASLFGQLVLVCRCTGRPSNPRRGGWEVHWPPTQSRISTLSLSVYFWFPKSFRGGEKPGNAPLTPPRV